MAQGHSPMTRLGSPAHPLPELPGTGPLLKSSASLPRGLEVQGPALGHSLLFKGSSFLPSGLHNGESPFIINHPGPPGMGTAGFLSPEKPTSKATAAFGS